MNANISYIIEYIDYYGNIIETDEFKNFNDAYIYFNGVNFRECQTAALNRNDRKYLYDNETIECQLKANDRIIVSISFSNRSKQGTYITET